MWNQNGEPVIPPRLEQAIDRQKVVYPDDTPALERLFAYLETTRPMLSEIKDAVCELYGYDQAEISMRDRQHHAALARAIFCYLAWRHTRFAKKQIGERVGLISHSTVLHAIRRVEKLAVKSATMRDDLDLLRLRVCEKILARRRAFS